MNDDGTTEAWEDNALAWQIIAARNSGHASAEIENDIDATVAETRAEKITRLLDDYYTDPDTDPDTWVEAERDFRAFSDPRASVIRLAALLLGLCIVAGAAAFVAATGGGVGWALAVFATLMAVFGLGLVAGRR